MAAAVIVLLFAELLLYGGDRREVAVIFAFAQTASLALVLALAAWPRRLMEQRASLQPLYLLFAALVLWIGCQLAPFGVGMAKAAWSSVGAPPTVTLDRFATMVELAKLLGLGAVFLLGAFIGRHETAAPRAFAAFGVAGGAYAAWALVGYYFGGLGGAMIKDGRLAASLLSPNTTAGVLGVFAAIGWTGALLGVRTASRSSDSFVGQLLRGLRSALPWAVSALLCLWALALSGSRAGVLAAMAGLVLGAAVLAISLRGERREADAAQTIGMAAAVLLTPTLFFVLSRGPLAARLSTTSEGVADRTAYLQLYLSRLPDLSWTGFGLGSFSRFNSFMMDSAAAARFWKFGAMHNVYLQWIYEAGFVGAALMFLCVGWILWRTAVALRRRPGQPWAVASLGASAILLAHGFVDFDLQIPAIAAVWAFVLGAGSAASRRS